MDRFAKQGTLFSHAYPESLPTIPARRTLFTGRRCFPFSDWKFDPEWQVPGWIPIPRGQKTLAQVLQTHGYTTALVSDVFHVFRPEMNFHLGFDEFHWIRGQECDRFHSGATDSPVDIEAYMTRKMKKGTRRMRELEMYLRNVAGRRREEDFFPAQVFRQAAAWLEQNYRADGFFLCVDCFDPHEPWDPPQYYRDMYNPGYRGVEVLIDEYVADYTEVVDDEELNHMRALYAGEVTMVDHWLGYFLEKVRLLDLDRNTLVAVMSDHGHPLGENRYLGKHEAAMHPNLIDLFFAIRHPEGVGGGRKIDAMVHNIDLYPTVFDFLNLPLPEWNEGKSLKPLMAGETDAHREFVTSIFKNYVWCRTERYAFTARINKTDFRLYDCTADPGHTENIAADHPEVCEEMFNRILTDAGGDIPYYDVIPLDDKIHD